MKYDVIVMGPTFCDIIFFGLENLPELGKEVWSKGFEITTGGMMNSAVAFSRLGMNVGLATQVGRDLWGDLILSTVKLENISQEFIKILEGAYPNISVAFNYKDDRGFISYTDKRFEKSFIQHIVYVAKHADTKHFHFSTSPEHFDAIKAAKIQGKTISIDTGWDPDWLQSSEIKKQIQLADVFFSNLDEAKRITGEENPFNALEVLSEYAPTVIIKLGRDGAICKSNGEIFVSRGLKVDVVDATGAGDCFAAGFLYGWLEKKTIDECLKIGNYCGARSVTVVGGYSGAPTKQMLEQYMKNEETFLK
jgi:sugar/nucleoside kinase (ribokinase family)